MGQVDLLQGFLKLPPQVQIGHVAAEVSRARSWHDQNRREQCRGAVARALEMLAAMTNNCSARGLRKEALRVKEVLAQFLSDAPIYQVSLADIEKYLQDLTVCFISSQRRSAI